MTIKIGEKIKNLRKQQDITQEKLAAYLNISYQAVSKWENGTALPDITLIPQIANFFGVSTDELLGLKDTDESEELKEYENLYFEHRRKGKILESIEVSRTVLKKYPRNYQWMLNLSYSLIQYNDTNEHIKYSKEHNFLQEAISLCERILDDCTIDSIRHSATQILCYTYSELNETDKAVKLAHTMPNIYCCCEMLLSQIYKGEKQIQYHQIVLHNMIGLCVGSLCMLQSDGLMGNEMSIDEKINFFETSELLFKAILPDENNYLFFDYRFKEIYLELAKLWCKKQNSKKAIDYLLLSEKCAQRFDDFIKKGTVQKFESIYLNRCTANPKAFSKNFEGTETKLLFNILNENKEFYILRDIDEFKDLQKRLRA